MHVKYRKSVSFLLPFHNFVNNRRMINHKHHNPKQISGELKRRLRLKIYKLKLLRRHLSGYNLVRFLKPATPLRLPERMNRGLIVALKTHAISYKPKEEALIRGPST